MMESAQHETLVGRKEELRELRAAIQKGESRLVWGPMDAGKTALVKAAISELPDTERRKCVYWTGSASGRQLLSHFVGRLYELGDSFVRKKVHADGATGPPWDSIHRFDARRLPIFRGSLSSANAQHGSADERDDVPVQDASLSGCTGLLARSDRIRVEPVLE
jgi:hypothetical protein